MVTVNSSSVHANTNFILKLAYWNCNGISSLCKQQGIVELEAMDSKELDLLFIDKTNLGKGSNVDMSAFEL